jgi:3-deoxy-D-manno-octulosonate 8-phosphate phosphatase (KDO 8-P phosphatase)
MKSIVQNILTLIESSNTKPALFSQFGVANINELPLLKIEEIAVALGVSIQQMLFGGQLNKAFPKDIKLLILDVDGVMTDAGMYYSENGDMLKKFNAKDGMGILQLTKNNFQVGVISSGFQGEMVKKRADLLKIQHFYLGRAHKIDILKKWCADLNITLSEVAMIGDDVNDLEVMQQIGYSACPSDAANQVIAQADCILTKKGGEGCIREFIEDVMGINVGFIS